MFSIMSVVTNLFKVSYKIAMFVFKMPRSLNGSSYQQSGVGNTILKKDNPKIQNKYSLDAPYARLRGDVQEI